MCPSSVNGRASGRYSETISEHSPCQKRPELSNVERHDMTLPAEFRSALQRASLLYLTTFSAAGRSGTVGGPVHAGRRRHLLLQPAERTLKGAPHPADGKRHGTSRPAGRSRPCRAGPNCWRTCRTWRGGCCVRTGGAIRCAGCSWARGCADPLRTVPRWSFGSIPRKGLRRPSRREIRAAVFPGRRGGPPGSRRSACRPRATGRVRPRASKNPETARRATETPWCSSPTAAR